MMATADIDLTLNIRRKRTPPPSVLVLRLPNEVPTKDQPQTASPSTELRSRQHKKRQITPHALGLKGNNSDTNDVSAAAYAWQRHSNRAAQLPLAPDVVYRNTYLDEIKRKKSATVNSDCRSCLSNSPRSPSPRSQHSQQQLTRLKTASSSSYHTSTPSPRKSHREYRTVYDYVRESIKQVERQRNFKQHNFATRIKRPQNDDVVLRHVLGEKKSSAASNISSVSKNDPRHPQNLLNYINHSRDQVRVLHTTTPNQSAQQHKQFNHKYDRHQTKFSENQNDSPNNRLSLMTVAATIGNS